MANFSDPYVELSDKDTFEMVLASKNGQWDTVWTILGKKPYLVNSIPKERTWAVLHQAVWWKNVTAVDKILKIPGCDSELLTKNGLRPLDIETTGEIKKLLQDHIKSNKLHKGSFFLTKEDLVTPPDGIDPSRLTNDELALAEMLKVDELTAASEKRVWKKFFKNLFFWEHLINSINPKTGLAPIHEVALAGDERVITELMNDDSCDLLVRTEIPAMVGSGKTAAEVATNVNVKEAILCRLKDRKDKHQEVPTCNKPYLVNSIPKERTWAVLHQAVWWKNVTAVDKILKIPGCNSELLTKNGLRPLDIETTGEIKKLLQDHIKSNKLHKGSSFLTPEDLVTPPDGIDPSQLTNDELALAEMLKVDELTAASEKRVWKKFFKILFFWEHLINFINPKTGLAPIHEAALAGDKRVITEIMNYNSCDLLVRTEVPAIVGSGKTAAEIATNVNVKEAILCKLKDRQNEHLEVPTCVDIQEAHFNLLWYIQGAIEKNKICDRKYKPNYLDSFLEMEEEIYKFMNEGDNWEAVRDALANEFKLDSAKFSIQKAKDKESFFKCLIKIYSDDSYYSELNKSLREHPCTLPDVDTENTAYRLFTALSNAVLLYGKLPGITKPFTGTTYRGARLSDTDLQKYKQKGYKFSWLSFTSSSLKELSYFEGNCVFIFDNTTECPWNPRGIEGISEYSSELEYLYPCGAQFEVTDFDVLNKETRIYLKLINEPLVRTEIPAIVGSGKTAAEIATNVNVKEAILCMLKDRKDKHLGVPTCVDIQEAHFNLVWYVQGAIEKNKICDANYKPNYLDSFLEMEEEIYRFMNKRDNWKAVRDALANTFKLKDAKFSIQKAKNKESFFECLIKIYTVSYYGGLNTSLREHPCTLPDVDTENTAYRLYTALTNAVLLYGKLPGLSEPFTGTTYRGAKFKNKHLHKYKKKGFKFAWLSFTTSSLKDSSNFLGNCVFIFDNTTKCPWNPRGIDYISKYSSELEYLYPCGAQFEVTDFVVKHKETRIYLKLINEPLLLKPIQFIYKQKIQTFGTLVNTYWEIMQQKQPLDIESEKLHNLHLRIESLKNFQQENAENRVKKIKLPRGEKAYHCRDCNTTCDYPCPEEHIYLGRCEFCIPRAKGACSRCKKGCHFGRHHRVDYRIEVEFVMNTVIDKDMMERHTLAVNELDSQNMIYENARAKFDNNVGKLPTIPKLVEDMQNLVKDMTDIVTIEKNQQLDNYGDMLEKLNQSKWNASSHHNIS